MSILHEAGQAERGVHSTLELECRTQCQGLRATFVGVVPSCSHPSRRGRSPEDVMLPQHLSSVGTQAASPEDKVSGVWQCRGWNPGPCTG